MHNTLEHAGSVPCKPLDEVPEVWAIQNIVLDLGNSWATEQCCSAQWKFGTTVKLRSYIPLLAHGSFLAQVEKT